MTASSLAMWSVLGIYAFLFRPRRRSCSSYTGLSETGNQVLAAMTEDAYAGMIADWRDRIMQLLSGRT